MAGAPACCAIDSQTSRHLLARARGPSGRGCRRVNVTNGDCADLCASRARADRAPGRPLETLCVGRDVAQGCVHARWCTSHPSSLRSVRTMRPTTCHRYQHCAGSVQHRCKQVDAAGSSVPELYWLQEHRDEIDTHLRGAPPVGDDVERIARVRRRGNRRHRQGCAKLSVRPPTIPPAYVVDENTCRG